jgi:hypothetical protein
MRKAILYLVALAVAATAVFFMTYFFGRHSSLEAELERLAAPRGEPAPGRSKGIPSLQRTEAPPEAPSAPQGPGGEPLGEGILATRSPLETSGMVVVADLPALAPPPEGSGPALGAGLAAFLSRPPAGLRIGLRALAGAAGECGATDALSALGSWGGGELATALAAASGLGRGPRNPAQAVEAAAEELDAVPGERLVVILAGGEEGCGADLCGAAPPPGGATQRIHTLLLAAPPPSGAEPAVPEAGTAGTPPPVFEPAWAAPYRCLAERSGGTVAAVSSPDECETALRRLAGDLESAVVVKAFHYTGQEVVGISPGGENGWGVTVRPGGGADTASRTRVSEIFPAAFAVPAGVHVLKVRYGGQERTAAVAVAPGERAEVRVSFATGELFLQALDAAGGEIVGDSAGFRCAWGAEVFAANGEGQRPVAATCSFPARLELVPGSYRVRARWKGIERVLDEVTVEAGASAVRAVSFGEEDR